MNKTTKYSPEVRARSVCLVFEQDKEHESQWTAIGAIAAKIGCTAETLRKWVRQAQRDQGRRNRRDQRAGAGHHVLHLSDFGGCANRARFDIIVDLTASTIDAVRSRSL